MLIILLLAVMVPLATAGKGGGKGNGGGNGGGGGGGDDGGGGGGGGGPANPAIAYVGNGWLGVMDEDGGNATNLALNARHPDWSPDLDGDPSNGYQGALAFELYLPDGTTDVHLADVRVVNGVPEALRVRRLPVPQSFEASWSPDIDPYQPGYQGRIAFTDDSGVGAVDVQWDGSAIDPSTTEDSSILRLATWDLVDVGFLYDPVWSEDGTRLIYGVFHYDFSFSLQIIDDLFQPVPRAVLHEPGLVPNQTDWSHGSSEVTFASGGVLYTLDVDVPDSVRLTGTVGQSPSYAPDDTRLAFDDRWGKKDWGIYVHNLLTGQSALLLGTKGVTYQTPDWRPE